ncbi:GNAT family N-acetyltransferase [Herbidospora sp. NEAU-GS84]|uniref:GNAT family N-acetyltransferase n=1 Tax=Herbidospora solisilvae TaxID=2696284 RepID=A0A7C9NKU3_9ACTN|nr:GNAT family N-acetyltransferase [Herbidospora solisilvae]NAS25072.1 GNAT family N-acetyltransferase [Herbidospora solisilvae]
MNHPIRPIAESEFPAVCDLLDEAFVSSWAPGQIERFKGVTEFDRSLAAFDGDRMVGFTQVMSFDMTVPGGVLPVAGVSSVGVLASHRRRGVLSALMRRQLADVHAKGEVFAALYASEAAIYGRYGYGRAVDNVFYSIPKHSSAFRADAPVDPTLRLRVEPPERAREDFVRVFDQVRPTRPGLYMRTAARWNATLADDDNARGSAGRLRCVLAEDDDGVRGYALFRVKRKVTDHDVPDGEVLLQELFAVDPAAYAALWRSLLDRDLCARVFAANRPVDDPVMHLLAEPRHLNAGTLDELWIRLVDVPGALTQRAYSAPVELVVEVDDDVCPWNAGRWRLSTAKHTCERTEDAPDLSLPVRILGAGYLGGRSLESYRMAGQITEHREGAVRELSAAMSWSPLPWGGLVF